MRQLVFVMVATAMVAGRSVRAEDKLDADQDRYKAINYLWGNGVDYKRDDAKGVYEIALKPGTTPADVQRWVRDYYVPALQRARSWADYDGERQISSVDFTTTKPTATGWTFMEPVKRRSLCWELAAAIKDKTLNKRARDLCNFASAAMAVAPLVEFDGTPTTASVTAGYTGDKLFFETEMFPKKPDGTYDATMPITSEGEIVKPRYIRVQMQLADDLSDENQFYAKGRAIVEQRKAWIAKAEAAVAAVEKKQAGAGGNKIVFGKRWFDAWDPVDAETGVLDCAKVYWKAYGPTGAHKKAPVSYVYATKVDGQECTSNSADFAPDFEDAWPIQSGGPVSLGRITAENHCFKMIGSSGTHTIAVDVWLAKTVKTDRYEVLSNGTIHYFEESQRVKTIASGSIKCTVATK